MGRKAAIELVKFDVNSILHAMKCARTHVSAYVYSGRCVTDQLQHAVVD